MTKPDVVIKFSLGATILLLVCCCITCVAIITHAMIEPTKVKHPPRLCPPSQLKEVLDEIKYGPVNRKKQDEIKDGFLDRFLARRQAIQSSSCQTPQYQTTRYQQSQCQPVSHNLPSSYSNCSPQVEYVAVSQKAPPTGVEYPALLQPSLQLPTPQRATCPTCPASEMKTGAFICSACREPKVGEQWHTDWLEDGRPLTYLCTQCNSRLNASQKQSVFQSYMRTQATAPIAGAFEPEVSR